MYFPVYEIVLFLGLYILKLITFFFLFWPFLFWVACYLISSYSQMQFYPTMGPKTRVSGQQEANLNKNVPLIVTSLDGRSNIHFKSRTAQFNGIPMTRCSLTWIRLEYSSISENIFFFHQCPGIWRVSIENHGYQRLKKILFVNIYKRNSQSFS